MAMGWALPRVSMAISSMMQLNEIAAVNNFEEAGERRLERRSDEQCSCAHVYERNN